MSNQAISFDMDQDEFDLDVSFSFDLLAPEYDTVHQPSQSFEELLYDDSMFGITGGSNNNSNNLLPFQQSQIPIPDDSLESFEAQQMYIPTTFAVDDEVAPIDPYRNSGLQSQPYQYVPGIGGQLDTSMGPGLTELNNTNISGFGLGVQQTPNTQANPVAYANSNFGPANTYRQSHLGSVQKQQLFPPQQRIFYNSFPNTIRPSTAIYNNSLAHVNASRSTPLSPRALAPPLGPVTTSPALPAPSSKRKRDEESSQDSATGSATNKRPCKESTTARALGVSTDSKNFSLRNWNHNILLEFPLPNVPIPAGKTLEEICVEYPNHLQYEGLDPFIQWFWTAHDIWNATPMSTQARMREEKIFKARGGNGMMQNRLRQRWEKLGELGCRALIAQPKLRQSPGNRKGISNPFRLNPNAPHKPAKRLAGDKKESESET